MIPKNTTDILSLLGGKNQKLNWELKSYVEEWAFVILHYYKNAVFYLFSFSPKTLFLIF